MRQLLALIIIGVALTLASTLPAGAQSDAGGSIHGRSGVVEFEEFTSNDTLSSAIAGMVQAQSAFLQANRRAKNLVEPALAAFEAEPTLEHEFLLYKANAHAIREQDTALGVKAEALAALRDALATHQEILAQSIGNIHGQGEDVLADQRLATENRDAAAEKIRGILPVLERFAASTETEQLPPELVSALRVLDEIAEWEGAIVNQNAGELEQIRRDEADLHAMFAQFEYAAQDIEGEIGAISAQRGFLVQQAERQVRYLERRRHIAGSQEPLNGLYTVLSNARSGPPPQLPQFPRNAPPSYTPPQRNDEEFFAALLRKYPAESPSVVAAAETPARGPATSEDDHE